MQQLRLRVLRLLVLVRFGGWVVAAATDADARCSAGAFAAYVVFACAGAGAAVRLQLLQRMQEGGVRGFMRQQGLRVLLVL